MDHNAANDTPKTIGDLKQWYLQQGLPSEDVTRFFIGKDIRSARAFGIYQENDGRFIVYKNKNNGVRAIRYEGRDEAYAVNELYQRLREEMRNQAAHGRQAPTPTVQSLRTAPAPDSYKSEVSERAEAPKKSHLKRIIAILSAALVVSLLVWLVVVPLCRPLQNGYYKYRDEKRPYYYYENGKWYCFENGKCWKQVEPESFEIRYLKLSYRGNDENALILEDVPECRLSLAYNTQFAEEGYYLFTDSTLMSLKDGEWYCCTLKSVIKPEKACVMAWDVAPIKYRTDTSFALNLDSSYEGRTRENTHRFDEWYAWYIARKGYIPDPFVTGFRDGYYRINDTVEGYYVYNNGMWYANTYMSVFQSNNEDEDPIRVWQETMNVAPVLLNDPDRYYLGEINNDGWSLIEELTHSTILREGFYRYNGVLYRLYNRSWYSYEKHRSSWSSEELKVGWGLANYGSKVSPELLKQAGQYYVEEDSLAGFDQWMKDRRRAANQTLYPTATPKTTKTKSDNNGYEHVFDTDTSSDDSSGWSSDNTDFDSDW